jgi:hypothetical protein
VDQPKPERAGGLGRFAIRAGWVMVCVLALVLGAALIVVGAATYTSAHTIDPMEIDGHVANYSEILIGNSYAHNELQLAGDPHTYVLDSRQFHPSLPERFAQDARITIWVDHGTTNVVALTLYDVMGLNPVTYTTPSYDNPTATAQVARTQGEAMAGAGAVLLLLVLIGLVAVRVQRRVRTRERGEAPDAAWHGAGPLMPRPAPAPSKRTTAASLSPIPVDSTVWPPRAAPSERPRSTTRSGQPATTPGIGASSSFSGDPGSSGWPSPPPDAGAAPAWDIGEMPTQKRQAQQRPAAEQLPVDEVPTQKTRAQRPTDGGNPPPATPS